MLQQKSSKAQRGGCLLNVNASALNEGETRDAVSFRNLINFDKNLIFDLLWA